MYPYERHPFTVHLCKHPPLQKSNFFFQKYTPINFFANIHLCLHVFLQTAFFAKFSLRKHPPMQTSTPRNFIYKHPPLQTYTLQTPTSAIIPHVLQVVYSAFCNWMLSIIIPLPEYSFYRKQKKSVRTFVSRVITSTSLRHSSTSLRHSEYSVLMP